MSIPSSKPQFVYATYIHTTPEKLWAALTDEQTIPTFWFGNKVCSDWSTGSKVQSFDQDDNTLDWDGEVIESQPPHKLVYSFRVEGRDEPASRVTYLIEAAQQPPMGPTGDAVKFTLIHEDFPADSQIIHGVSMGWPGIISGLKTLLESGQPLGLHWTPPSE
tara:strand:+ start:395 stop:880 length:486 start_codon:yes stop_codon:yes gene_type:complete